MKNINTSDPKNKAYEKQLIVGEYSSKPVIVSVCIKKYSRSIDPSITTSSLEV